MAPRKSVTSAGGDIEDTTATTTSATGAGPSTTAATQFPSQTTQQQLKAQSEGGSNVEVFFDRLFLLPHVYTEQKKKKKKTRIIYSLER
jgi:hypothetical protein